MVQFYGSGHGDWFWHELTTPDPDGAAAFYKAILGWDVEAQEVGPGMTYHLWRHKAQNHGGMMRMEGPAFEGVTPQWMIYMAVDDIDAAKAAIEQAGGKIHMGPHEAPGVGRFVIAADPQGAAFAVMQASDEFKAQAG
jgi:predicted enzyme related to lactoylglutathione lyase